MITLLTGENDFEIIRAVRMIEASFAGTSERFVGADIELRQLPDMLAGATLFADKRLVIIDGLSTNKTVWNALPDWLARLSDDVHLVLIEPKPDKRTKTYKELQKKASVQTFAVLTDRDAVAAERWVVEEASRQGQTLEKDSAHALVARVGVNQWQLFHALQKLAVFEAVTAETIVRVIDANLSENVFNLFEASLSGNKMQIIEMIKVVRQTEDPYMVFGLLSSQMVQLAALGMADEHMHPNDVAKALGAHPFAVSKLSRYATKLSKAQLKSSVQRFADADAQLKSSTIDPWIVIEQVLVT